MLQYILFIFKLIESIEFTIKSNYLYNIVYYTIIVDVLKVNYFVYQLHKIERSLGKSIKYIYTIYDEPFHYQI